nr:Chain C, C-terminal peptide from Inward rectifier potassium channel 4 [synthetic construct]3GJ9_D Chain D, C-terminal peptide from Inward rectifier potassium channel 4 [synthetic construct]
NISYRRESAI